MLFIRVMCLEIVYLFSGTCHKSSGRKFKKVTITCMNFFALATTYEMY